MLQHRAATADVSEMRRLLLLIGALLALPAFAAGATLGVQPGGAARGDASGRVIRVSLPRSSAALPDLHARISVAGATIQLRPYRLTRNSAWLRIPARDLPTSSPTGSRLRMRITLMSGQRRVLDQLVELRHAHGGAGAGASVGTAPAGAATASGSAEGHSTFPAGAAEGASGTGDANASVVGRLEWAPPELVNPQVVTVADGRDPDILRLSTKQDYVVKLPAGGIHGTVEINGGHNVVLIGGEVTVPATANQTDNGKDGTDTAIYVRAATGTVHIEGVLIKADTDTMFDGIDVNAPLATVQIENVRVEGVYGSRTSEHGDVIQTWGGAKALLVDELTASGDYQGVMVAPALGAVGSVHLDNVDLTAEAPPPALAASTHGGGIMLWFTAGTETCQSSPVALEHVFIVNKTGRLSSPDTVWPSPLARLQCDPVVEQRSGWSPSRSTEPVVEEETISWPSLPVSGSVTLGSPPGGSFVPPGVAGNGYVSPGYVSG
jgi:hypothetical protein